MIFQALPGLITGTKVHGSWGCPMIYMIGILLFYFFLINVDDKVSSYVIKWVYLFQSLILREYYVYINRYFAMLSMTKTSTENLQE